MSPVVCIPPTECVTPDGTAPPLTPCTSPSALSRGGCSHPPRRVTFGGEVVVLIMPRDAQRQQPQQVSSHPACHHPPQDLIDRASNLQQHCAPPVLSPQSQVADCLRRSPWRSTCGAIISVLSVSFDILSVIQNINGPHGQPTTVL